MLAKELIKEYIKDEKQDSVAVIGLLDKGGWWHVHLDEEIPKDNEVAFLVKKE